MKTLELKHINPYFIYNLTGIASFLPNAIFVVDKISKSQIKGFTKKGNNVPIGCMITEFKPILRPLSDLVKDIEIEGKKFVPIVELAKIFSKEICNLIDYELKVKIYEDSINANFHFDYQQPHRKFTYCFLQDTFSNDYKIIQKLFEWHFNVFDLPENLFVNYNDIKK